MRSKLLQLLKKYWPIVALVFSFAFVANGATTLLGTQGGTGQTSYSKGDFLYASQSFSLASPGNAKLAKLTIGNSGDVLTVKNGIPTWVASGSGAGPVSAKSGVQATEVSFFSAPNVVSGSSSLWWDSTNKFLGVGTSSPTHNLVVGSGTNNNVNTNINLLVQGVSDARLGTAVNDHGTFMSVGDASTYGGLFAFDYSGGTGLKLALNQFGGNVGIGTTNPLSTLEVAGKASISNELEINNASLVSTGSTVLNLSGSTNFADGALLINFTNDNQNEKMAQFYVEPGTSYNNPLFKINMGDGTGILTTRFQINKLGHLDLLGTASVSTNFETGGYASISTNITLGGTLTGTSSTASHSLGGTLEGPTDGTFSIGTVLKKLKGVFANVGRFFTELQIPNGAGGTTVDAAGEITFDTASNSFNGYNGTTEKVIAKAERCITYQPNWNGSNVAGKFFRDPATLTSVTLVASGSNGATWNMKIGSTNVFSANKLASGSALSFKTYTSFGSTAIGDASTLNLFVVSKSQTFTGSVTACYEYNP